ncbi:hypothetical protein CEXT_260831 [Caerostris extrusa]|uniref:Uncharacterized protein n=1 Tax=Caerostris extrusa TaxID=172846 RepID=A0AAV4W0K8_CAEEX|nr:hypothetical protein CEXT_260831 [Caerostris extrusa]
MNRCTGCTICISEKTIHVVQQSYRPLASPFIIAQSSYSESDCLARFEPRFINHAEPEEDWIFTRLRHVRKIMLLLLKKMKGQVPKQISESDRERIY